MTLYCTAKRTLSGIVLFPAWGRGSQIVELAALKTADQSQYVYMLLILDLNHMENLFGVV